MLAYRLPDFLSFVKRDAMITNVRLRSIVPEEEQLLFRIYSSTREEELAQVPWDDAGKEAFLRQQFAAQHKHYRQYFPEASFDLIVIDGKAAGRLYVDRSQEEIRIVEISLLPEFRGRGIGSSLIRGVLEEAAAARKPVRIHVEFYNRAKGLYERFGFRELSENGVYILMEWNKFAEERIGSWQGMV